MARADLSRIQAVTTRRDGQGPFTLPEDVGELEALIEDAAASGDPIRLIVIAAAVLIAWGVKRHYADAGAEDLKWILRPTTGLVSVVTGERFTWQAGEGYVSRDRLS